MTTAMGKNLLMRLSRTFDYFYANPAGVLQSKYQEFYPRAEIEASKFFARAVG
jgi:hypothetical protein